MGFQLDGRRGWTLRQQLFIWMVVIGCLQASLSHVANAGEVCGGMIEGYRLEVAKDYPGNNIGLPIRGTPEACTEDCTLIETCLGVVIDAKSKSCYRKSSLAVPVVNGTADSWIKCIATPPPPPSRSPPSPPPSPPSPPLQDMPLAPPPAPFSPIFIDAGNPNGFMDPVTGFQWVGDVGFNENGIDKSITSTNLGPYGNLSVVDQTLREWKSGESCYEVPVAADKRRYLIRLSFCYNNYDSNYIMLRSQNRLPTIGVSIEEYFVEAISDFEYNGTAYYTDYVATISDGKASICLFPLQSTDTGALSPPFINSLQILPVDNNLYGPSRDDVVLSNWVRLNAGGSDVVPTAANPHGYRTWQADEAPPSTSEKLDNWKALNSTSPVSTLAVLQGYEVPAEVYQTAREAGGSSTGYRFHNIHPVDPKNKFLVIFYFAELDPTVKLGDRVFNVWSNGKIIPNIDPVSFNGTNWGMPEQLVVSLAELTETDYGGWTGTIYVLLYSNKDNPSARRPILNGLEIYELIEPTVAIQEANAFKLRIDVGADQNYTDPFNNVWVADQLYLSGEEANSLSPDTSFRAATTVRYYEPAKFSRVNCYIVPVEAPGLYEVRAFFGNWDATKQSSNFSIAVEGVPLVQVQVGRFESVLTSVNDGAVDFCVIAIDDKPPFVSSLEVLQVNASAYARSDFNTSKYMFYPYARANMGGEEFGDVISNTPDRGFRQWFKDNDTFIFGCLPFDCLSPILSTNVIAGADVAPNYWPELLFQSGQRADFADSLTVDLNVFPGVPILIYLHFAELDDTVQIGKRLFSAYVNRTLVGLRDVATGMTYQQIDIRGITGASFTALTTSVTYQVPFSDDDRVIIPLTLEPAVTSERGPVLMAIEVFGLFPNAIPTVESNVLAMRVLKSELQVPESLGWTADPCLPVPWTGVKCTVVETDDGQRNSVSVINLANSGLTGFIPEEIGVLADLVTLNLTGNSLTGPIPNEIVELPNLAIVDLSHNQLNGSIPEDLASIPSLKTLYLQDNNLEGQLPSDLNPPPSSLQADYGDNPLLCGGSNLPACGAVPPGDSIAGLAPPTKTGGSSSSNTGAIVGGLIGGIVALLLIGALVVVLLRRKKAAPNAEKQPLPQSASSKSPAQSSKRQNPYWRSKTGEFELMNPGPAV